MLTNVQKNMLMKFKKHIGNPKKIAMYYAILAAEGKKFKTDNVSVLKLITSVKNSLSITRDSNNKPIMVAPFGADRGYLVQDAVEHLSKFNTNLGITGEILFKSNFPE